MFGSTLRTSIRKYYEDSDSPTLYMAEVFYFISNAEYSIDVPYYQITQSYRNESNHSFSSFAFGIDTAPPGYQLINRSWPNYIFNCIVDGKGLFNGTPLKKGCFFYTTPGELHTMISDRKEPWLNVWFSVNAHYGKQLMTLLNQQTTDRMFFISNPDDLLRTISFFLYDSGHVQNTEKYITGIIDLFMSYLLIDPSNDADKFSLRQRELIYNCVDYIDDNITTVTVKTLANYAHLEVKYFSKIFAALIGVLPKQYIVKKKMELAASYLSTTDYSIEYITTLLGYNHRNSLDIAFQHIFHMSPIAYRKKHQKRL